jgi:hypothetical protein
MGLDAHIGFHEPLDLSTGEYAAIASYIRQLGLPYAALSLLGMPENPLRG